MLCIINVYNDCKNNNTLTHLSTYMQDWERQQHAGWPLHTLWMGDFNWHHPLWDEAQNAHLFTHKNLDLTQPLLNMLGQHNMKMALQAFILTLWSHSTKNYTRVDNIFCSKELLDAIIEWKMDDTAWLVRTDHYAIITQLDIHTPKATWEARWNFRLADWPELVKTLKNNLANLPPPTEIEDI